MRRAGAGSRTRRRTPGSRIENRAAARRSRRSSGGRLAVDRVDEDLQLQPVACIVDAAVLERRAALDLERAETGVNDPFGAGNATGEHDLLPPVRQVVVRARIELRLHGAPVLERRVRDRRARQHPDGSQKRFLGHQTRRHLVGKPVARSPARA